MAEGEKLRLKLGAVIGFIRFATMSLKEFAEFVGNISNCIRGVFRVGIEKQKQLSPCPHKGRKKMEKIRREGEEMAIFFYLSSPKKTALN